jgi:hypothetical protein
MVRTFCALAAIAISSSLIPLSAVPSATPTLVLSPQDVAEAIQWGWQEDRPTPYELLWRARDQEERTTVVGTVYTPSLRVALWADGRQQNGETRPEPADVPRHLLNPALTIAIHQEPACCPPVDTGPPVKVFAVLVPAPSTHLMLCAGDAPDPHTVLHASADVSLLRVFDGEVAARTAAVLTLPLTAVRAGTDIVYELHRRSAETGEALHFVGFGMVRESDLAAWR